MRSILRAGIKRLAKKHNMTMQRAWQLLRIKQAGGVTEYLNSITSKKDKKRAVELLSKYGR
jgi:hypothetical protein